ncbi:hypothetical protein NKW54_08595 [Acetobacter cerevisiae]|uniref:Uncharacterized protein n=1 Tax=Acetobacter cerevisiae TaxID=178900 RepID=A0ABT1ES68_9PROT|nr:hypothetical protein [Acetobacter cerevisiae]MCP1245997.1 hypothetical protein [Acetobacter cerevisiae]MCP1255715.1 hypothetical protein [Acetobacter cerevisiae]
MTSPYSHRFVPTLKTPTKQTGGRSPSLIKIVLTAGAVTLGFEVAQQFLARAYVNHKWKVYRQKDRPGELFSCVNQSDLRSEWMCRFFEAIGGDKFLWLLKNPRWLLNDMRCYFYRGSLWISIPPAGRKKFKSREEFYDFCTELGKYIGDLLRKREEKL